MAVFWSRGRYEDKKEIKKVIHKNYNFAQTCDDMGEDVGTIIDTGFR